MDGSPVYWLSRQRQCRVVKEGISAESIKREAHLKIRFPFARIRPLEDHQVDRPGV
ncbi:hypothetical protein Dtox_1447 [Desulfofarcimen acetoxidans DSM 771]|uniref:Uncharacterized protein n=1 Tax=Desulfofarcimen acetoxidans (strain ATCC 49208 / DSM 771 / KCTC 5769 / VKM B-1644 / 5575) TaxID=485916 RepID=C8VVK0_DESAS|nr:hypothetical protein Dtox_1447 [Desulfofarcimen acetoxidans DSM 771]